MERGGWGALMPAMPLCRLLHAGQKGQQVHEGPLLWVCWGGEGSDPGAAVWEHQLVLSFAASSHMAEQNPCKNVLSYCSATVCLPGL